MGALKGRELEIDLYLTTKDGKVLEKVLKKREIIDPNPHLYTLIEMELVPPSDYFSFYPSFYPNRVTLDVSSLDELNRSREQAGIIITKNTSRGLIVTYQKKTYDLNQKKVYVDPTIVRALNVYSDRKPCRLIATIRDDKIDITISPQSPSSCEAYKIEDIEKDVGVVLSPISLYSARLTDKERERNFVIGPFPENFKSDRGESVDLLLKITRI
jgi:hypothetical protein